MRTRLGSWGHHQRSNKSSLLPDRIELPNIIGFSWSAMELLSQPNYEAWQTKFSALSDFHAEHDHFVVRQSDETKSLGLWVGNQRRAARFNSLLSSRRAALESIHFPFLMIRSFHSITVHPYCCASPSATSCRSCSTLPQDGVSFSLK